METSSSILAAARLVLGVVFLVSSISKAGKPRRFTAIIAAFRLMPRAWVHAITFILIGVEFVVAVLLIIGWQSRVIAVLCGLLLIVFTIAVIINLLRGRTDLECGCFGAWHTQKLNIKLVSRNFAFLAMASCVALWGGGSLTLDEYRFSLKEAFVTEILLPFALIFAGGLILALLVDRFYRLLLLIRLEG